MNYHNANRQRHAQAPMQEMEIFHLLALAFLLGFNFFFTCEPMQRKRKVKNTRPVPLGLTSSAILGYSIAPAYFNTFALAFDV